MAKGVKIGFRDTLADFKALQGDISAGRFFPIYLLMGEEPFFIDRLSDLLASSVLGEAERAFNQTIAYGKDSDAAAIVNLCRQVPMMGGRMVVIIKEAQQLRNIEVLSSYTSSPVNSTILVICHKGKNVDKRSQLYKSILANGKVFESVPPRDYEISGWLDELVRSKGLSLDAKALSMLLDHLGTDISRIDNELTKLLTSIPEGEKRVTADHIEQNIGISKDFNNFELTKALSERDLKRALTIADYFARNKKDNPLVVTISMIFIHFQRIFIYNYHRWLAQKKGVPFPSDTDMARNLKLTSAFFLGEYRTAAEKYPNSKVFHIFGLLREYDMKSKGINTGSADEGEMLRELLLKIMMI